MGVDETKNSVPPDASALDHWSVSINEFGETQIAPLEHDTDRPAAPSGAGPEAPETLGKYQVRGVLGRGGFGVVYLGYDATLDRQVAIKLPVTGGNDADSVGIQDDFLREARRLAQLSHPGIVTVLDVDVHDGVCCIVSEYLDGLNLNQWMQTRQVTWQDAAEIVAQVADALAYAHSQSTIHRDLKPGNIILAERAEGLRPVLVDFGLALSESGNPLAERGVVAGTPNYMSPEQASGLGHRIDGRTDIFALGVILYRMLCGQLPFAGENVAELIDQIRHQEPRSPRQIVREIPQDLEAVCLKALAKDIGDRFTAAGDMAAELRRVLDKHRRDEQVTARGSKEPRQRPEAVRRQVTALVCGCDLFESPELFENLDPEEQHELLQEYQQLCETVVAEFDGRIVQATEREVLACFGYPIAHEDSARRAVRAGLKLLSDMEPLKRRLRDQYEIAFTQWIGVHTGQAVMQDGEQLSMMGDARNVALRLEGASIADSVLMTESTRRLVQGYFDCEPRGVLTVRGASENQALFEVTGECAAGHRLDVIEPKALTPLIGRESEMSLLTDLWEQAVDGQRQIVCVIGEAGLGKSRLIRETRDAVLREHGADGAHVIEWRCSAFFRNTSLYPVVDYFERQLDFAREMSPRGRMDRLVAALEQLGLGDPENVALWASLLSVAPTEEFPALDLSPMRRKERTFEAILEWIQRCARRKPTLLIVEDLHWMDATTLEWIGQLIGRGEDDSILALMSFRPEFETPWGSRAHQTQIALSRLTHAQISEMMARRLGLEDLPAEIVARVIDRTEGVPLFVEEFCNMIQESGALEDHDGVIRLAPDFDLDAIPSTLQDLLVSRLDRLQSSHDLAQTGAALGREFTHEMIRAVTALPDETLIEELGRLVEADVLFQEGLAPQAVYTFKHALIQDAAYGSLLRKRRMQVHLRIADVLEEQFPETVELEPEVLAHHLTEADEKQRAINYWLKAGQRSQARSANHEAIAHYRDGLKVIAGLDPSEQRDQLENGFQLSLVTALMGAYGYAAPAVQPTLQRARELSERIGDNTQLLHVLWFIWAVRIIRAELDAALDDMQDMITLAERSGDDGLIMESCFGAVCTHYFRGEFVKVPEFGARGISLYNEDRCRLHAQTIGQNSGVTIRNFWSNALWHLGFADQARRIARDAVALSEKLEHPFSQVHGMTEAGWVFYLCRLGNETRQLAERALQISQRHDFPFWEACAQVTLGGGLILQGEHERGIQLVTEALKLFRSTGGQVHECFILCVLAEGYHATGHFQDALSEIDAALAAGTEHNELYMHAELLRLRGEVLLSVAESNAAEAEDCFQRSLETARNQQSRGWELRTLVSLARLRQRQGRGAEILPLLAQARGAFTEGFDTPDLIEADELLQSLSQSAG